MIPFTAACILGYVRGFLNKLVIFFQNKVSLGFILVFSFFVIFFGVFYVTAINKIRDTYIDQVYHEEELIASSGANSIQVFLEMAENSLLILSRNPHIANLNIDTQKVLDEFVVDWAGTPIIGLSLFDKDGKIIHTSNNIGDETSGIVNSLVYSDRDYFVWAEKAIEGDVYLGKPIFPKVKSPNLQYLLPIVTPIYRNGEFDGALFVAISLPKLTATYLDPLQVSPNARVYLMHPDSTIMATMSGYEGYVGLNYIEYLRNNPHPGSEEAIQGLTKALSDEDGGKLDTILYSPSNGEFIRFLITYYPMIHDGNHLTVALAVPYDDINNSLAPFKKGGISLISLFVVVGITLSAIGMLFSKIKRKIFNLRSNKEREEDSNQVEDS